MSRIFLTGDTHGSLSFVRFQKISRFIEKDDVLIIAGDFGFIWDSKDPIKLAWLNKTIPCKILFIAGNHENFDKLSTFPAIEEYGGEVRQINKQIYQLLDGQMLKIFNQNIWVMGKARSTDIAYRTEGVDWWKQEEPTLCEIKKAEINFEENLNLIHYVITHEAPTVALPILGLSSYYGYNDYFFPHWLSQKYNLVNKSNRFKKWFFGHMHRDKIINDDLVGIYKDIVELK